MLEYVSSKMRICEHDSVVRASYYTNVSPYRHIRSDDTRATLFLNCRNEGHIKCPQYVSSEPRSGEHASVIHASNDTSGSQLRHVCNYGTRAVMTVDQTPNSKKVPIFGHR